MSTEWSLIPGEVPADWLGKGGGGGGGHHGGHHGGGWGHGGPWWGGVNWRGPEAYWDDLPDYECTRLDDAGNCLEWARPRTPVVIVGGFDVADWQHQMTALKAVPGTIAKVLLRNGQWAIDHAKVVALAKDLPGTTARDNVYYRLQWHANEINKLVTSTPSAIYPSGDDLKKWVMQAFIEANAAEEGAAYLDQAWQAMWKEIADEVKKLPAAVAAQVGNIAGSLFGVSPWMIGAGLLAVLGVGVYAFARAKGSR